MTDRVNIKVTVDTTEAKAKLAELRAEADVTSSRGGNIIIPPIDYSKVKGTSRTTPRPDKKLSNTFLKLDEWRQLKAANPDLDWDGVRQHVVGRRALIDYSTTMGGNVSDFVDYEMKRRAQDLQFRRMVQSEPWVAYTYADAVNHARGNTLNELYFQNGRALPRGQVMAHLRKLVQDASVFGPDLPSISTSSKTPGTFSRAKAALTGLAAKQIGNAKLIGKGTYQGLKWGMTNAPKTLPMLKWVGERTGVSKLTALIGSGEAVAVGALLAANDIANARSDFFKQMLNSDTPISDFDAVLADRIGSWGDKARDMFAGFSKTVTIELPALINSGIFAFHRVIAGDKDDQKILEWEMATDMLRQDFIEHTGLNREEYAALARAQNAWTKASQKILQDTKKFARKQAEDVAQRLRGFGAAGISQNELENIVYRDTKWPLQRKAYNDFERANPFPTTKLVNPYQGD